MIEMKSKITIGLILLVGLSFIVTAAEVQVPLFKGWNLVYGFQGPDDLRSGDIGKNDIKAVYVYLPSTREFGRLHPDPEVDKILGQMTVNDLEQSVYWVFSSRTGTANINVDTPMPFEERNLIIGWNFFPVYEEMVGKKIDEVKGTCIVDRVFAFDPTSQEWVNMIDEEFVQRTLGLGVLIKVNVDCNLGEVEEPIAPPPSLPT